MVDYIVYIQLHFKPFGTSFHNLDFIKSLLRCYLMSSVTLTIMGYRVLSSQEITKESFVLRFNPPSATVHVYHLQIRYRLYIVLFHAERHAKTLPCLKIFFNPKKHYFYHKLTKY